MHQVPKMTQEETQNLYRLFIHKEVKFNTMRLTGEINKNKSLNVGDRRLVNPRIIKIIIITTTIQLKVLGGKKREGKGGEEMVGGTS